MVFRRKSKRVSFKVKRRPTYRRKRAAKMPLYNNVKMGTGFPKKICVKLKYSQDILLQSTAGAYALQHFGLNTPKQPNLSLHDHQPLYFDQYMGIYNHYHCIGAKMKVAMFQDSTDLAIPFRAVLFQGADTSVTVTDLNTLSEQSKSKSGAIVNGTTPKYLGLKWSAKKTFGNVMANDELRGDAANNPTEQSVGTIIVRPVDHGAESGQIRAIVDIEYILVFSEVRVMTTS